MNETRTKVAKSAAAGDKVHRLTEMETEEVSVVDRAANRRKFLVVKSEEGQMPGTEVVEGANGQLTTTAAKPAPAATAPASQQTDTAKAGATLTQDQKDTLEAAVEDAMSALEDAAKQIKGAKVVEPDPEKPETAADPTAVLEAVGEACGILEDAMMAAAGVDEDSMEEGAAPAADAPPPAAPVDATKRYEVRQAKRVIANAQIAKAASVVAKYGAKMSKERLSRFQQALGMLHELGAEVAQSVKDQLLEKAKGKKKPPAPPGAPGGPQAANAPPPAMDKSKAAKAVLPAEVQQQITSLEGTISTLAKQLKAREVSDADARGSIQPSNAVPVEAVTKRDEPFAWPTDMNTRVPKAGDDDYFG